MGAFLVIVVAPMVLGSWIGSRLRTGRAALMGGFIPLLAWSFIAAWTSLEDPEGFMAVGGILLAGVVAAVLGAIAAIIMSLALGAYRRNVRNRGLSGRRDRLPPN